MSQGSTGYLVEIYIIKCQFDTPICRVLSKKLVFSDTYYAVDKMVMTNKTLKIKYNDYLNDIQPFIFYQIRSAKHHQSDHSHRNKKITSERSL